MKNILFFALTFWSILAGAQNATTIEQQKTKQHTKDKLRVDELNNQIKQLLKAKVAERGALLQKAKVHAEEAINLAQQLQYYEGLGIAFYHAGSIQMELPIESKLPKAIEYFQNALPLLKQFSHDDLIPFCIRRLKMCYHHIGALQKAINLAEAERTAFLRIKDTINYIRSYAFEGHCYYDMGKFGKAYQLGMDAWKMAEQRGDTILRINTLIHLAKIFIDAGLPANALGYTEKIRQLSPKANYGKLPESSPYDIIWSRLVEAQAFLKLDQFDSALHILQQVPSNTIDSDYRLLYGQIFIHRKDHDKALQYFKEGFVLDKIRGIEISASRYALEIGKTYLLMNNIDSAVYYSKRSLSMAQLINALSEMRNAAGVLSELYAQKRDFELVYEYGKMYKQWNDSLAPEDYKQKLSLVQVQNELEGQRQQALLLTQQNKIKEEQLSKEGLIKKFLLGGMALLLCFGAFVVRTNSKQRQANFLLKEQKEEVQKTLTNLKLTQDQLVQKEKMASLGELTAGIAHEIQNPLNFVNNFSSINKELLAEMKTEMEKGNYGEAKAIAGDIEENEKKINQHGRRADAIVKGMLQHSRSGTGKKEPTNLNALADEYLRLSFHGLRAKDNSFHANFKTNFDERIDKMEVSPHDIGRVLLNLYNNAFYSVYEKKKLLNGTFEPTVEVSTKKEANHIKISVKDNGTGISPAVKAKIFQPFFTTKPTGQGTGLGLSLSYDIITKGHGGELKVETKEGEGAEFIIQLPVTFSS